MKVKSDLCYDVVQDVIRGPHTNVQVFVIRSLVGKWKQPIYYGFDKPVSKKLFFTAIEMIESAGFRVRPFVCDKGPSNQKLFSKLNKFVILRALLVNTIYGHFVMFLTC
uniref:Transposable element P transposase-like RNase H domain-containing protein n=1 Tax=Clastoptera arizonana TaxID=38151 RepID=A0A1B6D779_9HEMI